MNENDKTFAEVKDVVTKALGIEGRAEHMTRTTPLLGSVPEFDSMAVLKVILALEEHFQLTIDDDDVTGELFETLGTLADLVEQKLG